MVMPAAGISSLGNSGPSGCAGGNDGETSPRRRRPTGTPPPGAHGYDVGGTVDMLAGRCFGRGFPRIAQGLGPLGERPEHPVPHPMFGVRMGARGSPRNERPSPRGMDALWRGRPALGGGWVGWCKNPVRVCTTGPTGDGEASPEEYSGLAAAGLTLCRGYQVFRPGYGSHSQPGNTRPMKTRQKSPCFSSNRSTMESMIGSGKIRMVDPAVASQSGRATE